MTSILLSVRPEHVFNILNDTKTLELRKTIPHDFKGWVYVYVTMGKPYLTDYDQSKMIINEQYHKEHALNGKVVARFWFDEYEELLTQHHIDGQQIDRILKDGCIEYDDLYDYVGDKETIYAWHIKKLEIFDKPMELKDFMFDAKVWNQAYQAFEEVPRELHRAPQSWQYVGVKE